MSRGLSGFLLDAVWLYLTDSTDRKRPQNAMLMTDTSDVRIGRRTVLATTAATAGRGRLGSTTPAGYAGTLTLGVEQG